MKKYESDLYVIVNLTGGGGRAGRTYVKVREILEKNKVNFKTFASRYPGDVKLFVEKLTDRVEGDINLAVVGGDGTINEVINGVKDFERTRVGIIPTGSGNDFARGLKIPKNTETAVGRILYTLRKEKNEGDCCGEECCCENDCRENDCCENDCCGGSCCCRDGCCGGSFRSGIKAVDIGLTTVYGDENVALQLGRAAGVASLQRRFGISSGIGLDALVCKKVDGSKIKGFLNRFGLGSLSYIVMTVISLFTMEKNDVKLVYSPRNGASGEHAGKEVKKLIFFAAMNMRCEGGGVPMAPKADYGDGLLSCTLAHNVPKWKSFFILPALVLAKHEKMKCFMLYDDVKTELISDREMIVHIDGEYGGESKHVSFEIIPEKLKVIV